MREIHIDDDTVDLYGTVKDEVQEMLEHGIPKSTIAKKAGLSLNEFNTTFDDLNGYLRQLANRKLKMTVRQLYDKITLIYSGYLVKYRGLKPEHRICYMMGCPSISKECSKELTCNSLRKGNRLFTENTDEFGEALKTEDL